MRGSMLRQQGGGRARPSKSGRDKARASSPGKLIFQEPVGRSLPPSLQSFRWNVDKVERKLQEKIQEKTKIAGNFVYQQAYRLLECSRGEGIDFVSFKEQLRIKFGIILDDGELQLLFDKYDEDRNGTIDLHEFIRRVLPPDYNYGRQWFELSQQDSDDKQAALKKESRDEFLLGTGLKPESSHDIGNTGEASHWTLQTLLQQIQLKVMQKTPSGDDQYRRAFKLLRSGRDQGIRIKELRNNLKTRFGIFISEAQMQALFAKFDRDGSGEIDLKEFLQFVEPVAYPGNSRVPGGLWTAESESEEEEERGKEQEEEEEEEEDEYPKEKEGEASYGYNYGHSHDRNHHAGASAAVAARKERPKSANPKKTAMLQQRREQTSAASRLLEKKWLDTEVDANARGDERGDANAGRRSVTKTTQTVARKAAPTTTVSLANVRAAQSHLDRLGKEVATNDCGYGHTGVHVATPRPRSAGSVAPSSRASSAGCSVTSSVRGAAYMRRPSTPQHLRQKCLESRVPGAAAAVATADQHQRLRKDQTRPCSATARRASASVARVTAPTALASASATDARSGRADGRRATYGETVARAVDGEDGGGYNTPRVARAHAKQYDARPFSREGKVLLRSKTSSAGCR